MSYYRFDIFNIGCELINCVVHECSNENSAIAIANEMLVSSREAAIEVWTNRRRIYRETRYAFRDPDTLRNSAATGHVNLSSLESTMANYEKLSDWKARTQGNFQTFDSRGSDTARHAKEHRLTLTGQTISYTTAGGDVRKETASIGGTNDPTR